MKKQMYIALFLLSLVGSPVFAAQSTIMDSEGTACMGDDRSKKQTEQAALLDAKKRAVECASTYIKTETGVKNFILEKDLVSAYSGAEVKVLQELERSWYQEPSTGNCCRTRIRAEVIPNQRVFEKMTSSTANALDDPSAPLIVKAWTDKKAYTMGEKVRVSIKGNKPFYAKVIYKDAGGELLQILPNPHRAENYFHGGTVYDIPTKDDTFELEVSPPFGEETVLVYASTSPLGEIRTEAHGGVYEVKTELVEIGVQVKDINLIADKDSGKAPVHATSKPAASEFFEDAIIVKTVGK